MITAQTATRDEVLHLAHHARTIPECEDAQIALGHYRRLHPEDDSIMEVASMLSKLKDAIRDLSCEAATEEASQRIGSMSRASD